MLVRKGIAVGESLREKRQGTAAVQNLAEIFRAIFFAAFNMLGMSEAYRQLLEATIYRLESLKARGARFVAISPETLTQLNQRPKGGAGNRRKAKLEAQPAAQSNPKIAAFSELRQRAM